MMSDDRRDIALVRVKHNEDESLLVAPTGTPLRDVLLANGLSRILSSPTNSTAAVMGYVEPTASVLSRMNRIRITGTIVSLISSAIPAFRARFP